MHSLPQNGLRVRCIAGLLAMMSCGCQMLDATPPPTIERVTPSDPWLSLGEGGIFVVVDQPRVLPHPQVSPFPSVQWSLAAGQSDRATLVGSELRALLPGAFKLEAVSGERSAQFWVAATVADLKVEYPWVNTPFGSGVGPGQVIINTEEDWTKRYHGFFGVQARVSRTPTSPPPPPPSVPPVDFTHNSIIALPIELGRFEKSAVITQVTSQFIEIVVTFSKLDGVQPRAHYGPYPLLRVIPKVPDGIEVRVLRMPEQ